MASMLFEIATRAYCACLDSEAFLADNRHPGSHPGVEKLQARERALAQLGAEERAMLETLQQASLNILRVQQSAPNWALGMQTLTLIGFDFSFAAVSNVDYTDEELREQGTRTMPFVAVMLPAEVLRLHSEGSAATSKRSATLSGRQYHYRKISVGCCPRAALPRITPVLLQPKGAAASVKMQCRTFPTALPPPS